MGACHTSGMACPFRSSETISTIDSAVSRPSRLSGNHIAVGREKGIEMADRQFAVYSVDDESLTFYRYGRIPVLGTEFAGKHVTKVFENFNDHCWTTDAIADRVTGVSVADGGINRGNSAIGSTGLKISVQPIWRNWIRHARLQLKAFSKAVVTLSRSGCRVSECRW